MGPAFRELGFTGTFREFKYGSRSVFGSVRWERAARFTRAQSLGFTAIVDYWCGRNRIGYLMPPPARAG